MRAPYAVGVSAAAAAGFIIGWVASNAYYEEKLRREEAEELANEVAREVNGPRNIFDQFPVNVDPAELDSEGELKVVTGPITAIDGEDVPPLGDETVIDKVDVKSLSLDAEPNAYGEAIRVVQEPVRLEIIDEDEFFEEDGRYKGQISILFGDGEPTVLLDQSQCDNWPDLVGENIIKDIYTLAGPGPDAVLYIRNHERDEDYEVAIDTP